MNSAQTPTSTLTVTVNAILGRRRLGTVRSLDEQKVNAALNDVQ